MFGVRKLTLITMMIAAIVAAWPGAGIVSRLRALLVLSSAWRATRRARTAGDSAPPLE